MGISRWLMQCAGWMGFPAADVDTRVLDSWIHDALAEEANAEPPADSWERLLFAASDRQRVRSYGMWVLDEPLRDPPVDSQSRVYHNDSQRVASGEHFSRSISEIHRTLWTHLPPAFVAISNW